MAAITFCSLITTLFASESIKERVLMIGPWLEDGTIERASEEARFLVALTETVLGHRYLDQMGYYSSPIALPKSKAGNLSILNYEPKVDTFRDILDFYTGSLKLKRSRLVYQKEARDGIVILCFSSTQLIEAHDLHLFLTNEDRQVVDYRFEPVSRNTSTRLDFDRETGVLTISFGPVAMAAGLDQRLKFRKSQILIDFENPKFELMQAPLPVNEGKLRD